MISDRVLQAHQFFRERVARGQDYEKRHHVDDQHHPESDEDEDDKDNQVRENPAHQNVFHRPKE